MKARHWHTLILMLSSVIVRPAVAQQQLAAESRGPAVETRAAQALLARPVTVRFSGLPLGRAIDAIAAIGHVTVEYRLDVIARYTAPVTVDVSRIRLDAALNRALVGTSLKISPLPEGRIAVTERGDEARPVAAVAATITGVVTDERSRQGIGGAAILIEGTRLGAISGNDGRYRIANVPAGAHTVIARRIGYTQARQSVTVSDDQQVTVNFALEAVATSLNQVVITGTAGGEQRRSIGNAVSTINASEALSRSQAPNVSSLLNARAPGVVIAQNTGRLGAGPQVQIRGLSSIGLDNSPLLYIDGIRVNNLSASGPASVAASLGGVNSQVAGRLNDISPEDIESIEIIKGPAAATIYGTEAANGVIQIITKKGAGTKPQVRLQIQDGSIFFRDAAGRIPTNYVKDPNGNIVAWNGVESEAARGTPIFKTGQSRLFNGAVSGSRDPIQYYLSLTYKNDLGIESNNSSRQFNGHANLNVTPSSKFDFGTSLNFVQVNNHLGADVGPSAILGAELGHILLFPQARGFYPNWPAEYPAQLYDNSDGINRFTGSVTLNHRPNGWFSQHAVVGLDYTGEDARALERFAPPAIAALLPTTYAVGRIGQTLRQNTVVTGDYGGTAKFNLGSALSSATSIGGQLYRTEQNASFLGGLAFPGPGLETVSATATKTDPAQAQTINTTIGAYGQEQFGWHDRLFLTGALRVDNNSAFGQNFKWVTYPKVSAAWVINEEPFWHVGFVNTLKLRAAYGESGRAPAVFSALRTYNPVQGPNGTNAITAGSFGNADLQPERGKEVELGFEGQMLSRLNLDFTYYNKHTTNLIVNQAVAPSSGFAGNQIRNLGQVNNHGVELQATLQAVARENVQWEITGNIATAHNEIVNLGGLPTRIAPGQNNVKGYPINSFFARRVVSADRDPATGFATNVLCQGGPGQTPLACAQAPLVYVGSPTPTTTWSIGNTVTLAKRLRLYALVDSKRGSKLRNSVENNRCAGDIGVGLCEANYYPLKYSPLFLAQLSSNAESQGINDQFIQDASFVKLREISATYTLPSRFVPGFSGASFTLAARELHTWTKYRGPDPEVSASANVNGGGATWDQGLIPPLSRITATVNLNF